MSQIVRETQSRFLNSRCCLQHDWAPLHEPYSDDIWFWGLFHKGYRDFRRTYIVSLPHGTLPHVDIQKETTGLSGTEHVTCQFADDTTLFLKDKHQSPVPIQSVELFSKVSGLFLNIQKCKPLSIREHAQNVIRGIPVKTVVKYFCNKSSKETWANLTNKVDEHTQ